MCRSICCLRPSPRLSIPHVHCSSDGVYPCRAEPGIRAKLEGTGKGDVHLGLGFVGVSGVALQGRTRRSGQGRAGQGMPGHSGVGRHSLN